MKEQFVLIFRRGEKPLSNAEQQARASEVRNWALSRLQEDPTFEPRVLGDDSYHLPNIGGTLDDNQSVIALNFLEATDLREAIAIARTHPGLNYGTMIEVRPWKDPRNAAAPGTNIDSRA